MDTVPLVLVELHKEGTLEVALARSPDGTLPASLREVLERPLGRFVFYHRPRHWQMDLIPVTDRHAVLVCRECALRVPVATRPDVPMDLFLFLLHLMTAGIPHQLKFRLTPLFFNRYFNERCPRQP